MAALCRAASEEFNINLPKDYDISFCAETIDILHHTASQLSMMAQKGLIWLVEKQIKSRRFDKYVGNTGDIVPLLISLFITEVVEGGGRAALRGPQLSSGRD